MGFKGYFWCGFTLLVLLTALVQGIFAMMDTDPTEGSVVASAASFSETCARVTKNMTVRGRRHQHYRVCGCVAKKLPETLKLPAQIDFAEGVMATAPQSRGWLEQMTTASQLRNLKRKYSFKLSDGQMQDALTVWKVSMDKCLAAV